MTYLDTELAPLIARHGGLMDIFGVGVYITGDSGVGKSETALELIKRGHRLVADDVVEMRKVSDSELLGQSPEVIRHLMEIYINVHKLFKPVIIVVPFSYNTRNNAYGHKTSNYYTYRLKAIYHTYSEYHKKSCCYC